MSNPIESPRTGQAPPSLNLIAGRSKVVHAPSPILPKEPLCSAGRKRDSRTLYRETTAPVTCKNCGPDSAERLPAEPPSAVSRWQQTEQAARPCARTIRAAVRQAGMPDKALRITTRRWCHVELSSYRVTHGREATERVAQVIRALWNDHESRVLEVDTGETFWKLYIRVEGYLQTVPVSVVELCHVAALREDEARTAAPVTVKAEFPPGLRLRNPQTGASFEVIEHTHAVRMRNLRTGVVSAIPQEMARDFERLPAGAAGYLERVRDIRVQFAEAEAERLRKQARIGLQRLVAAASNMPQAMMMFATSLERASVALAKLFPLPHPNACDLCGLDTGERDHSARHTYEPPSDTTRLGRMLVRRLRDAPARERIHAAHVKWRRAVLQRELKQRLEREAPYWTERSELERAGLTTVPFDRQRAQPDAVPPGVQR